jgi:hypothetical protein
MMYFENPFLTNYLWKEINFIQGKVWVSTCMCVAYICNIYNIYKVAAVICRI